MAGRRNCLQVPSLSSCKLAASLQPCSPWQSIFTPLLPCATPQVGLSGSGKSSVVALLQRLYDPSEGQVLLDGTDLKQVGAGAGEEGPRGEKGGEGANAGIAAVYVLLPTRSRAHSVLSALSAVSPHPQDRFSSTSV